MSSKSTSSGGGGTSWIINLYVSLATNPLYDTVFLVLLLLAELILGLAIIRYVPYTEIDWEAYMQEVEMWLEGEYDYRKIYGGTGPLVYPAGFLYLFGILRWMTSSGENVLQAQYFFLAFYLMIQSTVLLLIQQCVRSVRTSRRHGGGDGKTGSGDGDLSQAHQIWSWRIAMGSICLSKRIHSIFMLRLFNDGITMLLLYVSMLLFTKNRWNIGCFVFSLAVSIKMNVLLFAPGLLLLLLQVGPDLQTVFYRLMLCCALPQLVLGAPFLLTFPVSYLRKAFELDRVFFYKWTVNFKVRVCVFLSRYWGCYNPLPYNGSSEIRLTFLFSSRYCCLFHSSCPKKHSCRKHWHFYYWPCIYLAWSTAPLYGCKRPSSRREDASSCKKSSDCRVLTLSIPC
jgi:hypothetical protein